MILSSLEHPLIINLVTLFHDEKRICIIYECADIFARRLSQVAAQAAFILGRLPSWLQNSSASALIRVNFRQYPVCLAPFQVSSNCQRKLLVDALVFFETEIDRFKKRFRLEFPRL